MGEASEVWVPPPLSLADSCQESLERPGLVCVRLRRWGLGIQIKGSAGERCSASDPPALKPSLGTLHSQHQMLARVPSFQNTNLPTAKLHSLLSQHPSIPSTSTASLYVCLFFFFLWQVAFCMEDINVSESKRFHCIKSGWLAACISHFFFYIIYHTKT